MGFIEKIYIILKYCDEYLHLLKYFTVSDWLKRPPAKYS